MKIGVPLLLTMQDAFYNVLVCGQMTQTMSKASLIISFGLRIFITILVGQKAEIKKTSVYTTFYFAGIANFLLLFGREEEIKPSPAAAIVW
jgi:hypothetical protein